MENKKIMEFAEIMQNEKEDTNNRIKAMDSLIELDQAKALEILNKLNFDEEKNKKLLGNFEDTFQILVEKYSIEMNFA